MRLAIIFPHVGYCTGWRPHLATEVKNGSTYHIAQALTYLYTTARHYTSDVRVFDFNFDSFESNMSDLISFAPDKVLLSSTVNSFDSTKEITSSVHQRMPGVEIHVGGPAVSSNYYLRPRLVQLDVPCVYNVTNRDIFEWTKSVLGLDDKLKFRTVQPDNSWIQDTYTAQQREKIRYTVVSSIGCTFKCSFCLNPKVYDINYKSPDVLRTEVQDLKSTYGADAISFADPFFYMREKHAQDMISVVTEAGLRWSQQTTLSTLTPDHLEQMAATGCTSVLCGIENFSTSEIDKPVSTKVFEDRLRIAKGLGIKIKPSFISGLLDMSFEQDVAQIHYIQDLIQAGLVENHNIQSNIYTPYIPDKRDRLLDVPFRFWGVMPVTADDEDDWRRNLQLCDLIYEEIFPETRDRYQEVRAEFLEILAGKDDMWLRHEEVPDLSAKQMTRGLTNGKVRVELSLVSND
ncbi:MAG TPA: radical SAM protein [Pseudonocardiaceae bacterium]|jgi:pyruvate-formate lyase-activating enzyme